MSHTEQESASDALKRHFAQRVTNQMRSLISRWRIVSEHPLTPEVINDLGVAAKKLQEQAHKFNAHDQASQSNEILSLLNQAQDQLPEISPSLISLLNKELSGLGEISIRKSDDRPAERILPKICPVFIAVQPDLANKLIEQLGHFGIENHIVSSKEQFNSLVDKYTPCAFIIDIDFDGPSQGLKLMEEYRKQHQDDVPKIFVSHHETVSLQERLGASRAGSVQFFVKPSVPILIRAVEQFYGDHAEDPYKVLVVDDSRSQALYCEKALSNAGMLTLAITDPMEILNSIESFNPEIIVMDMYMPGCTGTELASVIRQQPEYIRIPILFLSGEEDKNKQLDAMSQGGDDFLTKPVDPIHLSTTVKNRGNRARVLNSLIVRDSLTGLYNHTHILDRLSMACRFASEHNSKLCFAMVDIDFFKKVNDNYGHPVGDKVISALSLFLKQRLRKTDSVGRYGGEEFAVILPNTTAEDALHFMNDIREVFSQLEHSAGDSEFKVSFSCGICSFDSSNADFIVEQADKALYAAKKQGRNNVQLYVEGD
ncbi:MAG: diguanylate cyclase (GGDEF)-like protein [Crocinitomicaceae bacterium]|jgi:diguanylate cyclase (GGDEF)-like protein